MNLRHLLKRARAFKSMARSCASKSSCGAGRRRKYKRGGSIRGKLASVGKLMYKHRNKIAAAAALGAAVAQHRGNIQRGNIIRSQPLF